MANSLSNLVSNLAEGLQKIKCKYWRDIDKCENCEVKYKDCGSFLEYTNVKDNLIL